MRDASPGVLENKVALLEALLAEAARAAEQTSLDKQRLELEVEELKAEVVRLKREIDEVRSGVRDLPSPASLPPQQQLPARVEELEALLLQAARAGEYLAHQNQSLEHQRDELVAEREYALYGDRRTSRSEYSAWGERWSLISEPDQLPSEYRTRLSRRTSLRLRQSLFGVERIEDLGRRTDELSHTIRQLTEENIAMIDKIHECDELRQQVEELQHENALLKDKCETMMPTAKSEDESDAKHDETEERHPKRPHDDAQVKRDLTRLLFRRAVDKSRIVRLDDHFDEDRVLEESLRTQIESLLEAKSQYDADYQAVTWELCKYQLQNDEYKSALADAENLLEMRSMDTTFAEAEMHRLREELEDERMMRSMNLIAGLSESLGRRDSPCSPRDMEFHDDNVDRSELVLARTALENQMSMMCSMREQLAETRAELHAKHVVASAVNKCEEVKLVQENELSHELGAECAMYLDMAVAAGARGGGMAQLEIAVSALQHEEHAMELRAAAAEAKAVSDAVAWKDEVGELESALSRAETIAVCDVGRHSEEVARLEAFNTALLHGKRETEWRAEATEATEMCNVGRYREEVSRLEAFTMALLHGEREAELRAEATEATEMCNVGRHREEVSRLEAVTTAVLHREREAELRAAATEATEMCNVGRHREDVSRLEAVTTALLHEEREAELRAAATEAAEMCNVGRHREEVSRLETVTTALLHGEREAELRAAATEATEMCNVGRHREEVSRLEAVITALLHEEREAELRAKATEAIEMCNVGRHREEVSRLEDVTAALLHGEREAELRVAATEATEMCNVARYREEVSQLEDVTAASLHGEREAELRVAATEETARFEVEELCRVREQLHVGEGSAVSSNERLAELEADLLEHRARCAQLEELRDATDASADHNLHQLQEGMLTMRKACETQVQEAMAASSAVRGELSTARLELCAKDMVVTDLRSRAASLEADLTREKERRAHLGRTYQTLNQNFGNKLTSSMASLTEDYEERVREAVAATSVTREELSTARAELVAGSAQATLATGHIQKLESGLAHAKEEHAARMKAQEESLERILEVKIQRTTEAMRQDFEKRLRDAESSTQKARKETMRAKAMLCNQDSLHAKVASLERALLEKRSGMAAKTRVAGMEAVLKWTISRRTPGDKNDRGALRIGD